MVDFVAARDIRINASEAPDGTVHLVSEGLAAVGLPELELVGVPHDHARDGAVIINQIAEYTANKARIEPGQRVGIAGVCGALVARLVAGANAPRTGIGRLFGRGTPARLRIEEPIDDMAPLATLLSTVLLWRADAAFQEDEEEAGVGALRAAIKLFPGDPTRRDAANFGVEHNWENYLGYARLSMHLEGEEAIASWERAAERCARFEEGELGDAAAEIRRLERGALLERARLILETNEKKTEQNDVNERVVMTLSPIWAPAHSDTQTGRASRKMNIVTHGRLYSGQPLLRDPALVGAAVELVLAHRERPAKLVFAVAETLEHWEGGSDAAPTFDAGAPYLTGDRLLSLALAHVSRYVAGGMTATEVRAACDLDDDPGARESALAKRAVLEKAEFDDQVAAIGLLEPSAS